LDCIPFDFKYGPKLFAAIMFKCQGIHFTLHFSDTLLITGIKGHKELENVVYPTIMELSRCL
jgi:hypothetical protein